MRFVLRIATVVFVLCSSTLSFSQAGTFTRNNDGITIYPVLTTGAQAVRMQVVNDRMVRVLASPRKDFTEVKSLVTVYAAAPVSFEVEKSADNSTVSLKTRELIAVADLVTGDIRFLNSAGRPILAESALGRSLQPAAYEGERSYRIEQVFKTSPGDAWYGLGQHQEGLMNYSGNRVLLFQNNTEVAVPFLISKNNYGILWDNNSITKVGDARDFMELSALRLFSKNNEEGWLTASYFNDRNKTDDLLLEKAESVIKYEYVNDSKLHLPAEFTPLTGMVRWEGYMASGINGIHKFRVVYGGYLKMWVDGELLLDRWRQSWNSGSAILDIPFEAGKKKSIQIEWTPDGEDAYAQVKWLDPPVPGNENKLSFLSEAGKQLDYYFIYGKNMDEVIAGYRALTGKATMLPVWAFGLWQSRERYKTQDEVLGTVSEFRKRRIPLDNIVQDWFYWKENEWGSQDFDPSRFSNPDSMIKVLHEKHHARFMISVWPKFYEGIKTYRDFDGKGWLYKRNIADRQRDWVGPGYVSTFYDAFNPQAQKGFWDLINKKLFSKGVDAWWMDASEPDILSNVSQHRRKQQMYPLAVGITSEYLNAYPLVNAKGIYEGQRSEKPNQRVFILTRSAFSGMQRYAAATWSGDIASRWHDMKLQISAGVNFSMSGLPYWSMDIGGFAVEKRYEEPDAQTLDEWRELNTRWYQFGAFVPLFRVHGQLPYREIYNIAPETHPAYQSMLYYDKLRYRLLPYIYSIAGNIYHRDYTMMRGLVMDFPEDENLLSINDQFMLGPALLVNPVCEYKARGRKLYLPKATAWYDLYSGKYQEGGQTIEVQASYERIPVFVKAGSIIPFGPALQYTTEKKPDTITLYVYGGADGSFRLYEDEGVNYNYEKGSFSTIDLLFDDSEKALTIEKRAGEFPGMLKKRVFRIKYVSKSKALPLAFDDKGRVVKYDGTKIVIKLN